MLAYRCYHNLAHLSIFPEFVNAVARDAVLYLDMWFHIFSLGGKRYRPLSLSSQSRDTDPFPLHLARDTVEDYVQPISSNLSLK